jgi:hypothetical protein
MPERKSGTLKRASSSKKRATTKRASTKRASTKRASAKNMPSVKILQRSVFYTSNPLPGNPYGKVVSVSINNGKKTQSVSNLNKNGRVI